MTTEEVIAADAKTVIDLDGQAIVYIQDEVEHEINAIPQGMGFRPRRSDEQRSLTHKLELAIAKLDIAEVQKNADSVRIPGSWVDSAEATVTLRVGALLQDPRDPGMWVIGVG